MGVTSNMANKLTKEKNVLSVVVYVKDDGEIIEDFLLQIDNLLKQRFEAYEYILVNDFSTDDSIERVKGITDQIHGNVTTVNMAWRHGLELAMLAGLDLAIGDFILEFDSVLIDYDVQVVLDIYNKCLEGFDIVSAIPSNSQRLSSKVFYKTLKKISYKNMELTTETFRIISRRALNRVLSSKEKTKYRKALYHYSGFATETIKYDVKKITGKSRTSTSLSDRVKLANDVLISFTNIGTRVAVTLSLFFLAIALFMLGYTLYSYFNVENIEPGWTTIMLFLSFSFSGVFFILAILSKYITVLLIEVQEKPLYVYQSVEKLSNK